MQSSNSEPLNARGATIIVFYKVVRVFCLKLKISKNTELIEFSCLGKLHIDHVMVFGYFIVRFKPLVTKNKVGGKNRERGGNIILLYIISKGWKNV